MNHYQVISIVHSLILYQAQEGLSIMTVERIVFIAAGSFILLSLALSHLHHPNWLWFTAFVGANLLQSAFTGFCPLALILKKAGVPTEQTINSSPEMQTT